jgi:hypothetical protein
VAHSAIFNFEDISFSLPKTGPVLDLEATPERPDILGGSRGTGDGGQGRAASKGMQRGVNEEMTYDS